MQPLHDYFYRFPREQLQIPGRCRVRIYKRKNGAHTVLLTELSNNAGESITSACTQIATDLVATKGLNPKTTRWIQHDLVDEELPASENQHLFDELQFTWNSQNTAGAPQWLGLDIAQVEALTGVNLNALNRALGEPEPQGEKDVNNASAQTQSAT